MTRQRRVWARAGSETVDYERVMYAGLRMQVPWFHRRGGRGGCLGLLVLVCVGSAWADSGPKQGGPTVKLTLASLGVPPLGQNFLDAGASMLTVNFLDDKHLLLTYSERGLVPRLPDDPKDDDDRIVAAEILELPSGKKVARTEWHMHDHARYLWDLGQGRFMVRIGDGLSVMTPRARLKDKDKDPFQRMAFPWRMGRPTALFMSEDGGLLTIEGQVVSPHSQTEIEVGDIETVKQDSTTVLDFYRLSGDGTETAPLKVMASGTVRSPQPFYLPIDSRGYLWPSPVGNNQWAVTFDDMRGKTAQVGTLQSSCTPRLEMVSHSEFLAMTCRGSDDRVRMASYGLDAQETWQEDFGDFGPPVFAFAPEAGRFAVSRRVSDPVTPPVGPQGGLMPGPAPAPVDRQEIRVYQNVSGDLLLKTDCYPAMKTAENFSLAEDGSQLAVVRENSLEVYRLAELKPRDKEDIAEAVKLAPPEAAGPVVLKLLTGNTGGRAESAKATPLAVMPTAEPARRAVATVAAAKPAMVAADTKLPNGPVMSVRDEPEQKIVATVTPGTLAAAVADNTGTLSGGVDATGKRRPPTLLLPGEHAEYGGSHNGESEGPN